MAGIAGYQGKVIRQGNGGDFKVGKIERGALFFEISPELPTEIGRFLKRDQEQDYEQEQEKPKTSWIPACAGTTTNYRFPLC